MDGFTLNTRVTIDISINEFGTARDKIIWEDWSKEYPDDRTNPQQPDPNGNVSIRIDVRETIIICLRRSYEHIRQQMRSPINTQDDIVHFADKMNMLYALARRLSSINLEWPSGSY